MTDTSPGATRFRLDECYIVAALSPLEADYTLPVKDEPGSVVISEDQDRENFVEITLQCEWLPNNVYNALDPRDANPAANPPIRFRVTERDVSGAALRYWPGMVNATDEDSAQLWVRSIRRDWINRTVTVVLTTGELFLSDKIRLASTSVDTGAATVEALVFWSLSDVFTSASLTADPIVLSTTIPAGDRRVMQPGQSHMDLIKSELDAIDCRLYDHYGLAWLAVARSNAGAPQARLSTSSAYGTDADPIVWELTDTLSRDGRWADGVLIEYNMTAYGGSVSWQRSGSGVHTRGVVTRRTRPSPGGNAADKLATRYAIRGRDTNVTARARLDVRSRQRAAIFTLDATLQGDIRAVEYSLPEGTMRLRVEQ